MDWIRLRTLLSISSRWVNLFCEEWLKPDGDVCEYWRVEKSDSVIVIPVFGSQLLLPPPSYRPGVGKCTLDFPGGRIEDEHQKDLGEVAIRILVRELGLQENSVRSIVWMDSCGTFINSSFSNQKLIVAYAELSDIGNISHDVEFYSLEDVNDLFKNIDCLQCSYALLRFLQILRR